MKPVQPMTISECRALERRIRSAGVPPTMRAMFEQACAEVDMIERRAMNDGLGIGPLALIPWSIAAAFALVAAAAGVRGATSVWSAGDEITDASCKRFAPCPGSPSARAPLSALGSPLREGGNRERSRPIASGDGWGAVGLRVGAD